MNPSGHARRVVLLGVAASFVALVVEWIAWRNRLSVGMPHLAVGCAVIGSGCVAWIRVPDSRVGRLLVVAGAAWFISTLGDGTTTGTLASALAFLYVGVLLHAIVAYPSGRLRGPTERVVVGLGYLLSVASPIWRNDVGLVVAGSLVVAGVAIVWERREPTERRATLPAAWLGVGLGLLIATIPFGQAAALAIANQLGVRTLDTGTMAMSVAALLVAFGMTWSLVRLDQRQAVVADLVIELGVGRSTGLAAELRQVLGDPGLTIGVWRDMTSRFEDDAGDEVAVPETGTPGVAVIEDLGQPIAIVVHDPALTEDPGLRDALIRSARMAARNATLRQELVTQADQLDASRRRLLEAADAQRRVLEGRLRRGPAARLARASTLIEGLVRVASTQGARSDPHLAQAADHLALARRELDAIGRGLDPGSVAGGGIIGALHDLAARNPVPVAQELPRSLDLAGATASTLYFTASEALANVTRHAHASRAWMRVGVLDGQVALVVEDDGAGGADIDQGTGLRGLRDRLEALGGTLTVAARNGTGGTRLVAELPLAAGPVTTRAQP